MPHGMCLAPLELKQSTAKVGNPALAFTLSRKSVRGQNPW